ncbi:EscF/YscF/HrpA family type III secretion system needle major subunit [Providencia rettgeri]|nr:EscF/YscF/HrpA family type III secretion system needle major subunit [Providencia rettgeri]
MADIKFDVSTLETPAASGAADSTNELGMMYRSTANVSTRAKELGDYLKNLTDGKDSGGKDGKLEVDNPLVLARITAASGNYNMARQLQSNLMKAIKDTASAIIRNV